MSGTEHGQNGTETLHKSSSPRLVLAMLLLVYIFNFVDRQILAILAAPIQKELALDDAQMGMLGGLAFAMLYSTLGFRLPGLPIGPAGRGSSPVRW